MKGVEWICRDSEKDEGLTIRKSKRLRTEKIQRLEGDSINVKLKGQFRTELVERVKVFTSAEEEKENI